MSPETEAERLAEARARRARDVLEAARNNDSLMEQVRRSLAEVERGERGISLAELKEQMRRERTAKDV
jgi:hypothetical protein